jgi:cytochrome b561
MGLQRDWVTPIAIGAFLISAVTGVAIFFHIDTGLAKFAHEWLSWLLLIAVVLHVLVNLFGFKRYFTNWRSLTIMAVSVLVVVASFAISGGRGAGGPPRGVGL